jgi:hypothetical protein
MENEMITLKQWMEVVNYRITEGSQFQWECYGSHAYTLDSWNGDIDGHSLSIIFDTLTQEVYEVQAHDYSNNRAYRMINPLFLKKYKKEAKRRDCSRTEAWDDVDYTDLEVEEDFIEKATAIVAGLEYDTGVMVPVDFTDEELLKYMKLAHERNMTFNDFVNLALAEAIELHKQGKLNVEQPSG